jgi:hypothetical protein
MSFNWDHLSDLGSLIGFPLGMGIAVWVILVMLVQFPVWNAFPLALLVGLATLANSIIIDVRGHG